MIDIVALLCDDVLSYDDKNNIIDMDACIQWAKKEGRNRDAKNFNILVHPAYPWGELARAKNETHAEKRELIMTWLDLYEKKIKNLLKNYASSSLIVRETDSSLHDRFQNEAYSVAGHASDVGFLTASSMEEVLIWMNGMHPDDEVTVHGSGWLYCPEQFAFQWCALTQLDCFVPYREPIRTFRNGVQRSFDFHPQEKEVRSKLAALNLDRKGKVFEGIQHNTAYRTTAHLSKFARADRRQIVPDPMLLNEL